jgi:cytochrome c1
MLFRLFSRYTDLYIAIIVVLGAAFILFSESRRGEPVMPQYVIVGADAQQGPSAIQRYGCGSCHTIPGVSGAVGLVGPSLDHFGSHSYIAGQYPNVPENLVAWIENPQMMVPGNAMPNLAVSDASARDIAAYLYTLR